MNKHLIELFYRAEYYFFTAISLAHRNFANRAVAFCSGVSSPELNILIIKNNIEAKLLDDVAAFFQTHHMPWCAVVPEYLNTPQLRNFLAHHQLFAGEKSLAMVLALGNEPLNRHKKHGPIKLMNDQLEHWMLPLVEAFKSTIGLTESYKNTHAIALANHNNFAHLSYEKDGRPISSLTLSWHENIGRLDDIGTIPIYQRKGYASGLIKHALRGAYKIHLSHCFLEAYETSACIYENLGFKALFQNRIFMPK